MTASASPAPPGVPEHVRLARRPFGRVRKAGGDVTPPLPGLGPVVALVSDTGELDGGVEVIRQQRGGLAQ